jgi:hypothetical protein
MISEKYLLCVLCGQVGNDFVVFDVDGSIAVVQLSGGLSKDTGAKVQVAGCSLPAMKNSVQVPGVNLVLSFAITSYYPSNFY